MSTALAAAVSNTRISTMSLWVCYDTSPAALRFDTLPVAQSICPRHHDLAVDCSLPRQVRCDIRPSRQPFKRSFGCHHGIENVVTLPSRKFLRSCLEFGDIKYILLSKSPSFFGGAMSTR